MTIPYHDTELNQILVPVDEILYPAMGDIPAGYRPYSLLQLSRGILRSEANIGQAPLHFIEQRGPFQHGSTPIDMRWDARTIQILVAEEIGIRTELWDHRWQLLDLLRPNRAFGICGRVRPQIYRKWLPSGAVEHGRDLVTTIGSPIVTSHDGRFVCYGLLPGAWFRIDTGPDRGDYTVVAVPNDYTIQIDQNLTATAIDVGWVYRRGDGKRDLYVLMERGPSGNVGPGTQPQTPYGYREVLRLKSHDPFWYGLEQTETWDVPAGQDLTFDLATEGAYMVVPGGRWAFTRSGLTEQIAVVYWGTEHAKPVITIVGPTEYFSITNDTTRTMLEYTNPIPAGEIITIDTLAITVTDTAGNHLLEYLEGDIASFGIYPPPQAPNRINHITAVIAGGATGTTTATLSWRNRDIGL